MTNEKILKAQRQIQNLQKRIKQEQTACEHEYGTPEYKSDGEIWPYGTHWETYTCTKCGHSHMVTKRDMDKLHSGTRKS